MATERMTATEWAEARDPRALLAHAGPRVCHRHLSLVQVELAEVAWSESRRGGRLGGALVAQAERLAGLAREWCFFRVNDEALREAARALEVERPLVLEQLPRPGEANVFGLMAIVRAAAYACGARLPPRPEPIPQGVPLYAPVLAALRAFRTADEAGSAAATLAALIRRRIPYPETTNREWVAFPGLVHAGEFVLRIDGTRIGDAVPRSRFFGLTGARAVAFDEAQQNAEVESEAQARDRQSASVRLAVRLRELEVEAERAAREAEEAAELRRRQRAVAETWRRRQAQEAERRGAIARAEAQVRAESRAHAAELEARAAARRVERWSSLPGLLESITLEDLGTVITWGFMLVLVAALSFSACPRP